MEVGDRVIYTNYYSDKIYKGTIKDINSPIGYHDIIPDKLDEIPSRIVKPFVTSRVIKSEWIRLDVQYYREERLNKLLD